MSPNAWASTSAATYPPYRQVVQHQQRPQHLRSRPLRLEKLDDTSDEDEDEGADDAFFYRRQSIDSQHSQHSRTTSIPSYTSAYPPFPVLPPSPWPQADPYALPSYSPPDPSSPFTNAFCEDDECVHPPKRRCTPCFARRDTLKPVELSRVDSSHQALISTISLVDEAVEDDDGPSCFQLFRRRWARLLLRISFSVYRTRKRVASHLPSRAPHPTLLVR
ncbi:hypothetical protein BS47DRAFT_1335672 [Hydnum rufescens UP504]|uniref:Uncharacterized protein n=1 Tax=Hydnum rufescens UP504 TaxID=1448309 RepID=A0A9P6E228_9AGAM|nr:hypothetical protein BS47DRAFT_1335672 [Hydnum rufescens UP504]